MILRDPVGNAALPCAMVVFLVNVHNVAKRQRLNDMITNAETEYAITCGKYGSGRAESLPLTIAERTEDDDVIDCWLENTDDMEAMALQVLTVDEAVAVPPPPAELQQRFRENTQEEADCEEFLKSMLRGSPSPKEKREVRTKGGKGTTMHSRLGAVKFRGADKQSGNALPGDKKPRACRRLAITLIEKMLGVDNLEQEDVPATPRPTVPTPDGPSLHICDEAEFQGDCFARDIGRGECRT